MCHAAGENSLKKKKNRPKMLGMLNFALLNLNQKMPIFALFSGFSASFFYTKTRAILFLKSRTHLHTTLSLSFLFSVFFSVLIFSEVRRGNDVVA